MHQKIEIQNENLQLHLIYCKSLEGKKKKKIQKNTWVKTIEYDTAKIFLLN